MKETYSYKKLGILRIFCIYAFAMFSLVVIALLVSGKSTVTYAVNEQPEPSTASTEYIYVPFGSSENAEEDVLPESETVYVIREHMGKIGVFSEDGTLSTVIDVYVKTLPESDRRMLKEGFEVIGKAQLNRIIEDYDG